MYLPIPHQCLLLALDPETGESLLHATQTRLLLNAAVVAELMHQDRLVAVAANAFTVRHTPSTNTGVLAEVEDRLRGRTHSLDQAIGAVRAFYSRPVRDDLLRELVYWDVIAEEVDRFLSIPIRFRHPPVASHRARAANTLRDHIRTVASDAPPNREDLLLSLVRAARLLEQVWTPEELAQVRPRIVERTDRAPIGRAIAAALQLSYAW